MNKSHPFFRKTYIFLRTAAQTHHSFQPAPSQTLSDVHRVSNGVHRAFSDLPGVWPPSAWRCTETCPSPPWPLSWQRAPRCSSAAAAGPHLTSASAGERTKLKLNFTCRWNKIKTLDLDFMNQKHTIKHKRQKLWQGAQTNTNEVKKGKIEKCTFKLIFNKIPNYEIWC